MIKNIVKLFLPEQARQKLINLRKLVRYSARRQILKVAIKKNAPLKIIVGAAETSQKGWFSTNEQWLDITCENHWNTYFGDQQLISCIVAEHVFEHLSKRDSLKALTNMYQRLLPGGKVRIAVPDGYNPNEEYIRHVCVNGIGDDAMDHKQLLNVDSLSNLMTEAGFTVEHLEGYTNDGKLVTKKWFSSAGFIRRSRQNKTGDSWAFPDAATSLIVDGSKP